MPRIGGSGSACVTGICETELLNGLCQFRAQFTMYALTAYGRGLWVPERKQFCKRHVLCSTQQMSIMIITANNMQFQ